MNIVLGILNFSIFMILMFGIVSLVAAALTTINTNNQDENVDGDQN